MDQETSGHAAGPFYIMTNKPYGTLYTGVTSNLPERVHQHKNGIGSAFVRRYGLTMLVWFEIHETITAAIQRETSIKRWKRDWKIDLINAANPEWRDLALTELWGL
jgi:putative endonuclease